MHWTPTAREATAALAAFVPSAGRRYAGERNYDRGPQDRHNVSRLSPWLRHRLLLEEQVIAATLEQHDLAGAEKFVQEVFWRTYFKGWLEQRPAIWSRYLDDLSVQAQRVDDDRALRERYVQALAARTGIDCFDAWMRELRDYGYLHNHARMWFASIWIFTLQLPWQLGADVFYHHLLDADPASNTLSWRWVAGLHTRGKHYLARPDNIARYTDGRFDPGQSLNTQACALEEDDPLPPPSPIAPADPAPDRGRYGLLISAEDCHPESWPLRHPPVALASLAMPDRAAAERADTDEDAPAAARRAPQRDARAIAFADAALRDAMDRMQQRLPDVAQTVMAFDADSAAWPPALTQWARDHALAAIVTAWPPVGPTATAVTLAEPALKREGIALIRLRRDYDSLAWPHAKKGFFGLKKKIPTVLRELGIGTG
jgi:deoxyribodipyrimidine photo-lyase